MLLEVPLVDGIELQSQDVDGIDEELLPLSSRVDARDAASAENTRGVTAMAAAVRAVIASAASSPR